MKGKVGGATHPTPRLKKHTWAKYRPLSTCAQLLRTARKESGMTQYEVDDAAGCSRQTIGAIEQGRTYVLENTFMKLMDAMGYTVKITLERKKP